MGGFATYDKGGGVPGTTVYADNFDFTGTGRTNTVTTNGQLPIGSTSANAGGNHINIGQITSPLGTLSIGYSSPNITIDSVNGFVDLHTAKWIVNSIPNAGGNQTTIQGAINAASSGDTIFIMPGLTGTYTENLTLKAGVNLCAFTGDAFTPNVTIIGNATMSTAGTVSISNIRLQTNSASALTVSGSAASIVNLYSCYLNFTNSTGITFSAANTSALINIVSCNGNLGTTGIKMFAHSSTGGLGILYTQMSNTGASLTANTISAGVLLMEYSVIATPLTTSGAAVVTLINTDIDTGAINTTALIHGSSVTMGANACRFNSGSASAISVSVGSILNTVRSTVGSSNTNVVTGAGAIVYSLMGFGSGSSTVINTTTQTGSGTIVGSQNTAPSAGFLGQQIRSFVGSGSAVSLSSAGSKTITSISLTAGIWDITGIVQFAGGAGTSVTQCIGGLSTTDNTLAGNYGDDSCAMSIGANITFAPTITIPSFRATLSSTTIYYLIANSTFTVSTMTAYGRISATRVG